MEEYVFGDEFYYEGYVCVYEDEASVPGYLLETHPAERGDPLTEAERNELDSCVEVGADLLGALQNIDLKLYLFRKSIGSLAPLYKFSHEVLDEEPSGPLLMRLNRLLTPQLVEEISHQSDIGTPILRVPSPDVHVGTLRDLYHLIVTVKNAHLEVLGGIMKIEHDCGLHLRGTISSFSKEEDRKRVLALNLQSRTLKSYFVTLLRAHERRTRLVCSNILRVLAVFDQSASSSSSSSLRYLLVLHNYYVGFVFDLFEKTCGRINREFEEVITFLASYSMRLQSYVN